MEIYRQRINRVWFTAPSVDTTVTATVSLNGGAESSVTVEPLNPTTVDRYIDVPYISNEGTLRVTWSFTAQTFDDTGIVSQTVLHKDTYDVVTPILSDSEIKTIHPQATPDEIIAIEKAVRHVINAHTGQRFGKFVGTHKVRGDGSRALYLPQRLLTLDSVNGDLPGVFYDVDGDGYILRHFPWGVPPVKADYFGLHMHTGGVIHNPNNVRLGDWLKSRVYEIAGTWGWEEVPSQVREAAKLLVNDYACADQAYRDRYLTSMTAADWRIQFNSGAFLKTGNVRADQLLSDYVLKRGWAVI